MQLFYSLNSIFLNASLLEIIMQIKNKLKKIKSIAHLKRNLNNLEIRFRSDIDSYKTTRNSYLREKYNEIISTKQNQNFSLNCDPADIKFGAIEINTYCNLNCPMCNTAISSRAKISMDLKIFEKVVSILTKRGVTETHLHTIGEPLANPKFEEYLKILKNYGIKIMLLTNGQLLDRKIDLITKYIDTISFLGFSIDGSNQKSYELMRPPGKFTKLLQNLNLANEIKIEKRIYSVITQSLQKEIAYHLDFYSQFVPMENIELQFLASLSAGGDFFDENLLLKNHVVPTYPCENPFNEMTFQSDGNVSACGRDYSDDLQYGNILKNTPEELINNKKIIGLRKMHLYNKVPKSHLCGTCFQIDPRINSLFTLFYKTLIKKYSKKWEIDTMQQKIDKFFIISKDKIPGEEYLELFK